MKKIEKLIEKYNGYLITSLVCSEDISKTYVAKYIKEHGMEKVSRGVYITDDVWPDVSESAWHHKLRHRKIKWVAVIRTTYVWEGNFDG